MASYDGNTLNGRNEHNTELHIQGQGYHDRMNAREEMNGCNGAKQHHIGQELLTNSVVVSVSDFDENQKALDIWACGYKALADAERMDTLQKLEREKQLLEKDIILRDIKIQSEEANKCIDVEKKKQAEMMTVQTEWTTKAVVATEDARIAMANGDKIEAMFMPMLTVFNVVLNTVNIISMVCLLVWVGWFFLYGQTEIVTNISNGLYGDLIVPVLLIIVTICTKGKRGNKK